MTALLLLAGWSAGWLLLWRLPRLACRQGSAAGVSIVVPARDEEASLPHLLGAIERQVAQPAEVVVVDDGSRDRTARVAAAHGARVVTAPPLPPGWAGKPWACHVGAATATKDHLLFLDADVRLAPDALALLVGNAGPGLLSVQPYHEVERVDEHASAIPNVVSLMASGIAAVRPVDEPGLAFGPCLLTSRADLDAVGGFAAVRGEVLEDAALARRYEQAGLPVRCFAGDRAVRFRMYPSGGRTIVQGWAKGLTGGARLSRPLPLAGSVLWVTALLAVAIELVRAPSLLAAAAYAAAAAQVWWMLRRVGSFRWWAAALFPLAALSFVALFAWSAVQRVGRREVAWRGRRLEVGRPVP